MSHHRRTSSIASFSEALSSHHPSTLSSQPQPTMFIPSIKYTATKLQCISNYKLRIESSKSEPRLRCLLGHISIYDAVRDWRQSEAKGSIETIMEATKRLSTPAPATSSSPLQSVHEEPEPQPSEKDYQFSLHHSRIPSFEDFQAALELQIETMERIKTAQRQLQQMANDSEDGEKVEEYDSDAESSSDYDSYDGDEADWRSEEEGSDSDDSMTDPESVRSECASPVEDVECQKEDDYFTLRPLTPMIAGR